MKTYAQIQDELSALVGLPQNLPSIYLLGDTGAGKTCLVRQLLGTTGERFPSVRRVRTTVAPTEFVITNEPNFRAGFIIRPEIEIAQFVDEILEQAVTSAFDSIQANDEIDVTDLADVLAESPDQRFRLRCFLNESERVRIASEISREIAPSIVTWVKQHFPNEKDTATVLSLALDEFAPRLNSIKNSVLKIVVDQVNAACERPTGAVHSASFDFETRDRSECIKRLKRFLSVEDGSVSPAVAKARVRGNLRSEIIPANLEVVIVDGEGIGHDAKEARVLSTRHFDYFYNCDAIILVEDSEAPFRAGGKSAITAIDKNGYLPKLSLAFSRLDLVQTDEEGREFQIREVEKTLRNVLHALKDEQVTIERSRLDVRFFANMDKEVPDAETQKEISSLLRFIQDRYGAPRTRFVAPAYDYELLAGFLAQATAAFRQAWTGYIGGESSAPWQTQKAFTKRMDWKLDEYRYLKPVAEFSDILMTRLSSFLSHPIDWAEDITESHQAECLQLLRAEFSNELRKFVRDELLEEQHAKWDEAAILSGRLSTFTRRRLIMEIIESSAPDLTGEGARAFKDAVKALIESAIGKCSAKPS